MAKRLDSNLLDAEPILKLPYDRNAVRAGIVHIGVGNFHRAHQAVYIDDLLPADPRWGIVGVSLRRSRMRDALKPQDWLYSVTQNGPDGRKSRVVGSILDVLHAPADPQRVIDVMTTSEIKLVTLTVSEKGYGLDPATGGLDVSRDDIRHDLDNLQSPKSAVGFIVAALSARRSRGIAPFTSISCDNLPSNGTVLQRLVHAFASKLDKDLADWIEAHAAFPCTMVDRIVPATTDEDRRLVEDMLGFEDAWPVMTEPFRQWVIEDKFCNERPDFSAVGAQFVDDVAPYELMKLRMLNGAHSLLAYLGQMRGRETVADAMADNAIATWVRLLWAREVPPTVPLPGDELDAYATALAVRFGNTALKHKTYQIAADGSQKVPQRFLAPLAERGAKDLPVPALSVGVAGWLAYLWSKRGDVDDPNAQLFRHLAEHSGHRDAFCEAILDDANIIGGLAGDSRLKSWILSSLKKLPV